jgi:hypothetical protein
MFPNIFFGFKHFLKLEKNARGNLPVLARTRWACYRRSLINGGHILLLVGQFR